MITIQNIAGGDQHTIRSVAALARIAATRVRYGGWVVVDFTGLDGLSLDDAHAVLAWSQDQAFRANRRPRTAADWREIARRAIAFDERGRAD